MAVPSKFYCYKKHSIIAYTFAAIADKVPQAILWMQRIAGIAVASGVGSDPHIMRIVDT